MLRNYLTTAIRNLLRNKVHTLIGIVGLAIGLATGVLLLRFVQLELSYDRFHTKLDRIYRIMEVTRSETNTSHSRFPKSAVAARFREEIPEIETAAHVHRVYGRVEANGKIQGGRRIAGAEREIFDIVDIPVVAGSLDEIYADPSTIAVRRSTARFFFGDEDPIGKVVTVTHAEYGGEKVIRAILADQPNATLRFHVLHQSLFRHSWTGWGGNAYVLLGEGADPQSVEAKLGGVVDRHLAPDLAKRRSYELYPLSRVYLHMAHDYNVGHIYEAWGDIEQVYLFSAVAILVLLIACINFTNLSIARSAGRAREVGMRKVTGALKRQLVGQFLGESVLIGFVSLALSLVILEFVLPEFNAFFRRRLALSLTQDPGLLGGIVSVTVVVGLLAGAYPAFVLSSMQPVDTLKGTFRSDPDKHWVRKGLVVFQFGASIALIIGSGVIYKQFEYIQSKDHGYDRSDHLVHMNPYVTDKFHKSSKEIRLADRYEAVKQAFLDHPDVMEGTAFKQDFGLTTWGTQPLTIEGHEGKKWRLPLLEVDDDFIDVFRIQVLEGRKFDRFAFPSDHAEAHSDSNVAFIVNEAAVALLGWKMGEMPGTTDAPIGKAVRWSVKGGDITGSVVGVVNDFHYLPLTEEIGRLALAFRTKGFFNLTVRVREGQLDAAMPHLEKTWKHFAPKNPFARWFEGDNLKTGYKQAFRTQILAHVITGIAIFLACIGLFGLASHAAETRQKEIGVRKALGASVPGIVTLVSREFMILTLAGAAIAIPIAYPFVRGWLDGFAYRMSLGPETFVFGIAITLIISQATVTYHALRAARTNPAVVLRKE